MSISGKIKNKGMGIVGVLLIIVLLSAMGGVIAMLVATGSVAKTNELVREQAKSLIDAGFEYALKQIDSGANPDGQTRNLGKGQFTVGYDTGTGTITVNSSVSGLEGASTPNYSIQGPVGGSMGDCLVVTTSGAYLSASKLILQGITIRNNCLAPVTIASMTTSWTPSMMEQLSSITINGNIVYGPPQSPLLSGAIADITDVTIPNCTTIPLTNITFNSSMDNKNFTLLFTMSDGTTKSAFVQFIANNEAACLDANLSAAYVNDTGNLRLLGGTLTNTCSAPTTIRVVGMTVSWAPTTNNMTAINFNGGGNEWSGSVASGTAVTLTTALDIVPGTPATETYLQFSGDVRGRTFTVTYRMRDGTTKTVTVGSMAACLTVSNTASCIGPAATRTELQLQSWNNVCTDRTVTVNRVQTTWSGGGSRRWTVLRVNNTNVWTGSLTSGSTATLTTPVTIAAGSAATVNYYRFNGNMQGRTFSHLMTLSDTSTVAVAAFNPPNCP